MRDGGLFGVDAVPWFNGGLFAAHRRAAAGRGRRGRAQGRERAELERHRPQHLRHAVRARAGPGQAQPARRALHRPGHHPAAGGAGGAAPAAGRVARRRAAIERRIGKSKKHGDKAWRDAQAAFVGFLERLERLPRARPGLRQRQLPVPGAEVPEGHRAPGQPRGRGAGPGTPARPDRPAQRAGHRAQRIRRRTGARDGVDRRAAVAHPARLRLQDRTRCSSRWTTSSAATR